MKIVKNEKNTITVLLDGCGTKYIFICIDRHFNTGFITLNIEQARQVADEILRLCVKLESETKTD